MDKRKLLIVSVLAIFIVAMSLSAVSASSSHKTTKKISKKSTKYVASVDSDKFHKTSCRFAKKIKKSNKITFKSRSKAKSYGYKPCKVCHP